MADIVVSSEWQNNYNIPYLCINKKVQQNTVYSTGKCGTPPAMSDKPSFTVKLVVLWKEKEKEEEIYDE